MNYSTFTRLVAGLVIAMCLPVSLEAQDAQRETIRVSNADGAVSGQVYTMLDNQKTPLAGNVSLTDLAGATVATLKTDADGNFTFKDLKEGSYKAISVAGDYVGDTDIEVVRVASQEATSVGIAVGPASSDEILNAYAALPAAQFSSHGGGCGCSSCNAAPVRTYSTGCNTCSGGGVGLRSFGSRGGFGGFGGGGFGGGGLLGGGAGGFGRLALLGGALAIPIALSGDDDASPAE